jgi:hypothetical protein
MQKKEVLIFLILLSRITYGQDFIRKDSLFSQPNILQWEIGTDLVWLSNTAEVTPTIFIKKHQKNFTQRFMIGFRSRQKLDPVITYLSTSLQFDVENGQRRDFLLRYGLQKQVRTAGKINLYVGLDYEYRYKLEEGILFETDSTRTKPTYMRITSYVNGHALLAVLGVKYSPIANLSFSIENDAGLY